MSQHYNYNGKERSFARAQGLISALLTMAVLTSLGANNELATGLFSVCLTMSHSFHFWYFAIRTQLGSPRKLYKILTGPYRPMFWPAPLLIAYSAAGVGYPSLFWFTSKAIAGEPLGTLDKVTLILFWSLFVYFYADRLASDLFVIKFDVQRVVYSTTLLLGLVTSMLYSGLIQSLMEHTCL